MGRLRARRLLATLTLIASLLTGVLPDQYAEAWVYQQRTRRAGTVVVPQTSFNAIELGQNFLGFNSWIMLVTQNTQMVVRRAPRPGRQKVLVLSVLQRWDGTRWVGYTHQINIRTIRPGRRAVLMPKPAFYPSRVQGYWRLSYGIIWAARGRVLGTAVVVANELDDALCQRLVLCDHYAGHVYVHRVQAS